MFIVKEIKIFLWVTAICYVVILGFQSFFPVLAPFLLGILLACLIEPIIKQIETHLKLSRKFAVSFVLGLTLLILLTVTGIVFLVAYQEALRILPKIPTLADKLLGLGRGLINFLNDRFQIPEALLYDYLAKPEAIEGVFRSIVVWVINLVPAFPELTLALSMSGVTAYFFSRDKIFFSELLYKSIPQNWRSLTIQVKEEVMAAFIGFIQVEILLAVLTSFLTALAFGLLKIPGAIAYGFLAGILDFIPVVGPGLLYLPLVLILCLFQNYQSAFLLIVLYFLVLFLRQLGEAKLIGENLEVHPLVVIFLVYLGMKFLGLTGIMFAPILVITLRAVLRAFRTGQVQEGVKGLEI